jgi:hypothetical protein
MLQPRRCVLLRLLLSTLCCRRCAQCLGLLGALDPSRVQPELRRPGPFSYAAKTFLVQLVLQLVRVLQAACDTGQLEMTSYALQQILQHFGPAQLRVTAMQMQVGGAAGFAGCGSRVDALRLGSVAACARATQHASIACHPQHPPLSNTHTHTNTQTPGAVRQPARRRCHGRRARGPAGQRRPGRRRARGRPVQPA